MGLFRKRNEPTQSRECDSLVILEIREKEDETLFSIFMGPVSVMKSPQEIHLEEATFIVSVFDKGTAESICEHITKGLLQLGFASLIVTVEHEDFPG